MARHKDGNWNLGDTVKTWDEAQVAILMDIRDELKKLNRNAVCGRYQTRIAEDAIIRIDKRLQKRFKTK